MSEDVTLDEFADSESTDSGEFVETAAGRIPHHWRTTNVDALCELRNGKATNHADIGERDFLVYGSNGPIGSHSESNFEQGLIFGRVGAVGEVERVHEPVWVSDNAIQASVNDKCNTDFLYYYLSNKDLSSLATKTAQPLLNQSTIGNVTVPLPPLSEQRKIATVLYTVDQAIEKTEKLIEQKERLRDAVAQESLVLETNSYTRPTEWGRIPDSWEEKTLEEVCQLITDGTHMPPERTKTGIPLIGVDEIDGIRLDFSGELSYISKGDYEEMSDSNKPDEQDVLVAVVGATIGKSAIVARKEPFAIQRSLGLLRTNESVLPRFLHTVVQSPNFKRQLDTRSRATAQAGVYLEELKQVRIPVPPIEEQENIADRVDTITHLIRNENKYLSSLERLKRGLMQDLLSGTVRTTDTNIEVPDEIAQYG
ncbi:restriction endonuclease subunit S [Salarchaeum japonicum]|uniref:restriction endonuclease subunit S n=1 Tax=Salarchaeum japonicum TaxID=555573 RepID=UPI003C72A8CE